MYLYLFSTMDLKKLVMLMKQVIFFSLLVSGYKIELILSVLETYKRFLQILQL